MFFTVPIKYIFYLRLFILAEKFSIYFVTMYNLKVLTVSRKKEDNTIIVIIITLVHVSLLKDVLRNIDIYVYLKRYVIFIYGSD